MDALSRPLLSAGVLQRGPATPCYMAPELFHEEAPFSSASDIWALGCMLYECAAGHPPFLSSSFQELVHAILHSKPTPLHGTHPQLPVNLPAVSVLMYSNCRK